LQERPAAKKASQAVRERQLIEEIRQDLHRLRDSL
jgi:predicted component of type VI protein secretion system